ATAAPHSYTPSLHYALPIYEPQRNAVHAQVVVDVERLDPGRLLDELHGGGGGIEARVERNGDHETGQRPDEREAARQPGTVVAAQSQHQQAEYDRNEDRKRKPGKSVGCHVACRHWGISTKKVTSAMMPMIIANA